MPSHDIRARSNFGFTWRWRGLCSLIVAGFVCGCAASPEAPTSVPEEAEPAAATVTVPEPAPAPLRRLELAADDHRTARIQQLVDEAAAEPSGCTGRDNSVPEGSSNVRALLDLDASGFVEQATVVDTSASLLSDGCAEQLALGWYIPHGMNRAISVEVALPEAVFQPVISPGSIGDLASYTTETGDDIGDADFMTRGRTLFESYGDAVGQCVARHTRPSRADQTVTVSIDGTVMRHGRIRAPRVRSSSDDHRLQACVEGVTDRFFFLRPPRTPTSFSATYSVTLSLSWRHEYHHEATPSLVSLEQVHEQARPMRLPLLTQQLMSSSARSCLRRSGLSGVRFDIVMLLRGPDVLDTVQHPQLQVGPDETAETPRDSAETCMQLAARGWIVRPPADVAADEPWVLTHRVLVDRGR